MIYTTADEIAAGLKKFLKEHEHQKPEPEFTKERLNRNEAAKLAGVSLPTFAKMVKALLFPEHGFGRKKFYLKSEIISALKNVADQKKK